MCFLRWRVNFARTATNVAAALASPVAFLTDANCDADKGFFASATTCNAGSRSLAMAFRAQGFCWHSPPVFGTYLRCNTSGSLAMLAAIRRVVAREQFGCRTPLIMVPHILDGRCPVSVSRLRQTR